MRKLPIRVLMPILLATFACSSSDDSRITADDCQQVREHAAELRLAMVQSKREGPAAAREMEKHRANFSKAGGQEYLDQCVKTRSLKWITCSLEATTSQEMQRCK